MLALVGLAISVISPANAEQAQDAGAGVEASELAVDARKQEAQEARNEDLVPGDVSPQPEAQVDDVLPEENPVSNSQDTDLEQSADVEDGQPTESVDEAPSPCHELDDEQEKWLDRAQTRLYDSTCNAAAWFDSFFGTPRHDASNEETYGRLGMSALWDQRNGFKQKVRFRARYALPAMREKGYFFLGRGDEKEVIEESRGPDIDSLPTTFNSVEDDSFLIGLGYGKGGVDRGVRFNVGAVLGFPVSPFVKLSYRRAWALSEKDLLRVRPMGYWRGDEGLGASLNVDVDHLFADHLMLRFGNWGNVSQSEDIEGLSWGSSLELFQGFSERRALTYKVLIQGETLAEVRVQNYGFELRYRQRILRKWLFMEVASSLTWPREFSVEERNVNWGASIGLEMYFGPVPDAQMR
jgi:hypothetical protein